MRKNPMNKYNLKFALVFTLFPIIGVGICLATKTDISFLAIIMLLIFFVIGIYNWGLYQKIIKQYRLEKKIRHEGTLAYGTFIRENSNMMIKNTLIFSIIYSWKDENGKCFESESMAVFYDDDIEWFKKTKTFKIKYIGSNSAIIDEINSALSQNIENKYESNDFDSFSQDVKHCLNCGIKLQNGEKECPVCGNKKLV